MSNHAMPVSLERLVTITGGVLEGDGNHLVDGVATLHDAQNHHVAALTNSRYKREVEKSNAGCILVAEKDAEGLDCNRILHPDPSLGFAMVSRYFNPPRAVVPGVADSAVIDVTATVATSAEIGANTVVGANAVIGEGVYIGPGCMILDNAIVGESSRLIANVTLCEGVEIGTHCLLHPGVVIGSDGFGFANEAGKWLKVPQIGRVVVGNLVEIGANTSIDRGSLRDTVIGDGVKLDNQIQIAHNVVIGAHTAIAGLVGIAGSTTIGSHCTIAGEAGIVGHLQIGDYCHIGARAMVTRSLKERSNVSGGVPAVESGLWRRMIARLRRIDAMADRISALEKMKK